MRLKVTLHDEKGVHIWRPQTFIAACMLVEVFIFMATRKKVNVTKENLSGQLDSASWIIEKED